MELVGRCLCGRLSVCFGGGRLGLTSGRCFGVCACVCVCVGCTGRAVVWVLALLARVCVHITFSGVTVSDLKLAAHQKRHKPNEFRSEVWGKRRRQRGSYKRMR